MKLRNTGLLVTIALTLLALPVLSAFSASESSSAVQLANRAGQYLLRAVLSPAKKTVTGPGDCGPTSHSTAACTAFVISGESFPSTDQRIAAVRACAGNFSDACVKFAVSETSFPSFDQKIEAARACAGNYDLECAKFVLSGESFPSFEDEINAISACRNSDAGCVKSVIGSQSFPSLEDKIRAANACGGR